MPYEGAPTPSEEEVEETLKRIERDSREPGEPRPSQSEIDRAVRSAARQMGDVGNIGDHSIVDIVHQLEADGWRLTQTVSGRAPFHADIAKDKETKIVGTGETRYVFVRDKKPGAE